MHLVLWHVKNNTLFSTSLDLYLVVNRIRAMNPYIFYNLCRKGRSHYFYLFFLTVNEFITSYQTKICLADSQSCCWALTTGISLHYKLYPYSQWTNSFSSAFQSFSLYGHTPVLLHIMLQAFSIHIAFLPVLPKHLHHYLKHYFLNLASLNYICHSRTNSNDNFSNHLPWSYTQTQIILHLNIWCLSKVLHLHVYQI